MRLPPRMLRVIERFPVIGLDPPSQTQLTIALVCLDLTMTVPGRSIWRSLGHWSMEQSSFSSTNTKDTLATQSSLDWSQRANSH